MAKQTASRSAVATARNIILLARDPIYGKLVAPEMSVLAARFLRAQPGIRGLMSGLLNLGLVRAYLARKERRELPGIALHTVLSKRWIRARVEKDLLFGTDQVVVIGAGFDPTPALMARQNPKVHFFELDEPATQQIKRAGLAKSGGQPANLVFYPVDLTQTGLDAALVALPGYNPRARTIFVMQDVLMHRTEADVCRLLSAARAPMRSGSILLADVLAPLPDGRLALHRAGDPAVRTTSWAGEPYRWGVSEINLQSFLSANGWNLSEVIQARVQLNTDLPDLSAKAVLPAGEYLFRAVG